jgi:hypothetical protein
MKELYSFEIEREVEVEIPHVKKVRGKTVDTTKKVKKKVPYRVVFLKPNKADIEDAEFFYSQKFNEFINLGFLTRAMLNKKMGDNGGIASKEFAKQLESLIKENVDASRIVEFYGSAKNLDEEQKQKLEDAKSALAITQKQIIDYETAINEQYNHTADVKAEHKLYEFFIFNFSYFEEVIDGEKQLFELFEGEDHEEKREFYLELCEDEADIENKDLIKNKQIYDKSFNQLIKVVNVWYRGLGKNQEEIDKIIEALDDVEKEQNKLAHKTADLEEKSQEKTEEEVKDNPDSKDTQEKKDADE